MGSIVNRGTKNKPRFIAQYKDANGVRHSKLLKGATSKEAARVLLNAIEHNVMLGRVGIEQLTDEQRARRSITVAKLSARFLGDVDGVPGYAPPRIKNLRNYRLEARSVHNVRILPKLGARPAATITAADVERLRDDQLAGDDALSPASVVQTLAALSKLYTWGLRAGLLDCANPVRGVERPRVASTVDYLSRAEVTQLLAEAEHRAPDVWPMIATGVYAGLRLGELYGLRWADVHLDATRLDVMRSYGLVPKSGRARHVPINPELARILRDWKSRAAENEAGLVFPIAGARRPRMGHAGDHRGLGELLKAAKCHAPADGKRWHMLRHTFASHFMMAGGNILTLQKILGHSDIKMTLIYAHLSPDHLAAEVARMSFAQTIASTSSIDDERRRRAIDAAPL